MKPVTFKDCAAQGELLIRRIKELPKDLTEQKADNHIVGHSETGHHHTINQAGVRFYESDNPTLCYLAVDSEFADLVHNRSFDTHQTLRIPHGIFEIRRQQEYTPEGWRQVID